jgi:hypothetical protein
MKTATSFSRTAYGKRNDLPPGNRPMKLRLFFMLFDVLILMAYPIAYLVHRLRKMKGVK